MSVDCASAFWLISAASLLIFCTCNKSQGIYLPVCVFFIKYSHSTDMRESFRAWPINTWHVVNNSAQFWKMTAFVWRKRFSKIYKRIQRHLGEIWEELERVDLSYTKSWIRHWLLYKLRVQTHQASTSAADGIHCVYDDAWEWVLDRFWTAPKRHNTFQCWWWHCCCCCRWLWVWL